MVAMWIHDHGIHTDPLGLNITTFNRYINYKWAIFIHFPVRKLWIFTVGIHAVNLDRRQQKNAPSWSQWWTLSLPMMDPCMYAILKYFNMDPHKYTINKYSPCNCQHQSTSWSVVGGFFWLRSQKTDFNQIQRIGWSETSTSHWDIRRQLPSESFRKTKFFASVPWSKHRAFYALWMFTRMFWIISLHANVCPKSHGLI